MSRVPLVIVAGLDLEGHDRLRQISENKLAPNGKLVCKPMGVLGFSSEYAQELIAEAFRYLVKLPEDTEINIVVIYVAHEDEDLTAFIRKFFPFSLPGRVSPPRPPISTSKSKKSEALNEFMRRLSDRILHLRDRTRVVSGVTDKLNRNPILLPIRNFKSESLTDLLGVLFDNLSDVEDPLDLIASEVKRFQGAHPPMLPPNSAQRCFSDKIHYFCSPGHARHGFFRHENATANHEPSCLLNARSRLGGAYDYKHHFDCQPVRRLNREYPNCHDKMCAPSERHVNIAPNDCVI